MGGSLDDILEGEEGVTEAHTRLQYLSLKSVVDDIAFVANATIRNLAEDWGMVLAPGTERAPNQVTLRIVFATKLNVACPCMLFARTFSLTPSSFQSHLCSQLYSGVLGPERRQCMPA